MIRKIICILLIFLCCGCKKQYEEYYILQMDNDQVTLAPAYYDRDTFEQFEDKIIVRELARHVTCKEISVYTIIKEEKEASKRTNKNITLEDIKMAIEYDSAYVRVTFNSKNQIDSITLWGELIVYE